MQDNGIAWVSFSLKRPEITLLNNLRLETYQAFSDFVLSAEIAGFTRVRKCAVEKDARCGAEGTQ